MIRATAALLVLALAGCATPPAPRAPVEANCSALCRVPCDTSVPRWTPADPEAPEAWDTYPEQVTFPVVARLRACEVHRQACVQCLDRLTKAGVLR